MKRTLVLALAAAATLFGATAAQAARVNWSVGIDVPVGAVVPSGYNGYPAYAGYPGYAPPVVYAPRPRFVEPAPLYLPRPSLYAPRIWLPPLPPLPFFGHDRWHHDEHGWRR
jgi:hypothetical protein